jgi:DNA-binding response OmpR family regulator
MANVLIVEDDLLVADLLQEALETEGYSISGIARTVAEAKRLTEQDPPDFAVIDIRLAHGDLGTDFGAHLRATTHAGILYSTGNSTDQKLSTLQGDAVMTKPYRMRDVACGLRIIAVLAHPGQAHRTPERFPHSFQLLNHPAS